MLKFSLKKMRAFSYLLINIIVLSSSFAVETPKSKIEPSIENTASKVSAEITAIESSNVGSKVRYKYKMELKKVALEPKEVVVKKKGPRDSFSGLYLGAGYSYAGFTGPAGIKFQNDGINLVGGTPFGNVETNPLSIPIDSNSAVVINNQSLGSIQNDEGKTFATGRSNLDVLGGFNLRLFSANAGKMYLMLMAEGNPLNVSAAYKTSLKGNKDFAIDGGYLIPCSKFCTLQGSANLWEEVGSITMPLPAVLFGPGSTIFIPTQVPVYETAATINGNIAADFEVNTSFREYGQAMIGFGFAPTMNMFKNRPNPLMLFVGAGVQVLERSTQMRGKNSINFNSIEVDPSINVSQNFINAGNTMTDMLVTTSTNGNGLTNGGKSEVNVIPSLMAGLQIELVKHVHLRLSYQIGIATANQSSYSNLAANTTIGTTQASPTHFELSSQVGVSEYFISHGAKVALIINY